MKHPKPDIGDTLHSQFIANVGTIRKLLRYWGTEEVPGEFPESPSVTVLKQRKYYYPKNRLRASEKLFRFLGMYEGVLAAEFEGIEEAWVYFNKNKDKNNTFTADIADFVVHNLNLIWWDPEDGERPANLTLTTKIVIEGQFQSATKDHPTTTPYLDSTMSQNTLITTIQANYEDIWATCLISQQGVGVINKGSITNAQTNVSIPDEDDLSQNDPWMQTVARYVLRSPSIPCTIKKVEFGLSRAEAGELYTTYILTIEIPYIEFQSGMSIIAQITNDLNTNYSSITRTNKLGNSNGYYTKQAITKQSYTDIALDETTLTRQYCPWEEVTYGSYEQLWHKWGGTSTNIVTWFTYKINNSYAINADVLQHPHDYGLTYKGLVQYLLPLLDDDHKKEKASGWQKVVGIIVFIVAVIIAYVTWGAGSVLIGLAKAILVGALVVTALQYIAAQMGATDWALAFGEVSKMIEPLTWVASIILIVTGIGAAINSAKQAAATEAGKSAAEVAISEVLTELAVDAVENMVNSVIDGATQLITGQLTTTSLKFLTSILRLFNTVQKLKLESINDRNRDLASEYEKMAEDAELENDVLRGFAQIYTKPATADWSMYAGLYDLPYEPSGGPLHTGNVQRTTKQALRKAKYNDPVFNEILII